MTVAARLTVIETTLARLVNSRGPRVSDLLKQARARAQRDEVASVLYDVATLEAEATRGGVAGQVARARLRITRRGVVEACTAPGPVRKDERGEVEGQDEAADGERASTAPVAPATAVSVVDRIDRLLAAHARV